MGWFFYDAARVIHELVEDYCDKPELAYPIIFDDKISVYWKGGADDLWCARTVHTAKVEDESPLRAAMMAFLLLRALEARIASVTV